MTVKSTQVELHMLMMLHLVGDDQYRYYILHCIILFICHISFYVFKPADRNCTSPNQRINMSQSNTCIRDIVLSMRAIIFTHVCILIIIFVSDDMDVDEALEDVVISYVNMDAR